MAQDDYEFERHLTPNGWTTGSEWVNGSPTKTVEPPPDRIETWIELHADSSSGWAPPSISSKLVWESPNTSAEDRAELNKKFPRPEAKPWKQIRKRKRRPIE